MPKVSVIVVSWNRVEMMRKCLASIAGQTFQDYELIVVDNGSSDGAECYATLRNATNLGFARAANQGIAASTGDLVALLNNDAEADERWLEEIVHAADYNLGKIGMFASKIMQPDGKLESAGCEIHYDGNGMCRGRGQEPSKYDRPGFVTFPSGCAAMYRRSMLDKIGLFDERFFLYNEDTELGLRAQRAGYPCLYAPKAVVTHHGASKNNLKKLYHNERSRILLMWSHFDFGQVFWSVPWTIARYARMLWGR